MAKSLEIDHLQVINWLQNIWNWRVAANKHWQNLWKTVKLP